MNKTKNKKHMKKGVKNALLSVGACVLMTCAILAGSEEVTGRSAGRINDLKIPGVVCEVAHENGEDIVYVNCMNGDRYACYTEYNVYHVGNNVMCHIDRNGTDTKKDDVLWDIEYVSEWNN